ncbi:hypothetical protein EHE19_010900 [Ruminiclostridium herbifermentans]|uniref:Uncharacterized protein n=1 Tax=Ruminiclostridium herbifermentans TaxID=2488810 RepID=A0A7H1VJ78_9FIRM|nr:hypothetical protein EHE19_010900 [Ruminiclostridium herbifermentans]
MILTKYHIDVIEKTSKIIIPNFSTSFLFPEHIEFYNDNTAIKGVFYSGRIFPFTIDTFISSIVKLI